ncbi:MAG: arylsulfatase [Desulfomonilaceae bacterium]
MLKVDGEVVATEKMEHTVPLILQWNEPSTSANTGTPVDDRDYQVPFKFTGKIAKLAIAVDAPKLTPEDEKRLMETDESAADRR